jgi:hypothetical protein
MSSMRTNEIGVSESIGFILILGIVITGMGLVTVYGYPILLQEQQNANINNMERNMIVLQNEVKGLVYNSVPYRETTMQISGGSLYVIRPNCPTCPVNDLNLPGQSYFTISRNGVPISFDITNPATSHNFYPGLLQFESSPTAAIIGLQNGAVVTNGFSQTGGSTMLSEPRWFLDDDPAGPSRTLVINMVNITSDEALARNGMGTVQMKVSELYPPQDITISPGETITITYKDLTEGYTTGWENYFSDSQVFTTAGPNPCSVSTVAGSKQLSIPAVTRVIIKSYKIEILSL